ASHRANGCVAAAIGAMLWRAATAAIPPRSRRNSAWGLFETRTDAGPNLDLRAQKLRSDLCAEQCLAFGQHAVGRVADDIARCPIDEEVLLLDPERKFRFARHLTPRIEPVTERGSRRGQRPLSTWWKKSAQVRLKRSGSSRLTACPVFGNTTSAAVGIARF